MNVEQKQRMAHELGQWNAAIKSSCGVADLLAISTRMAALLQEMIAAPEPEPVAWNVEGKDGETMCVTDNKFAADRYIACGYVVAPLYTAPPAPSVPEQKPVARVTGYYAGYLSIATADGRVLPAGTALYAAPPHQSEHHLEMVNTPAPSVPDGLTTCKCRWKDKEQVQQCKIHHYWAIAIDEWADRAKLAEAKLAALTPESQTGLPFGGFIDSANAPTPAEAPADVARDAARYRWLLDSNWYVGPDSFYCTGGGELEDYQNKNNSAESLDAAVDAAIAAKKGGAK